MNSSVYFWSPNVGFRLHLLLCHTRRSGGLRPLSADFLEAGFGFSSLVWLGGSLLARPLTEQFGAGGGLFDVESILVLAEDLLRQSERRVVPRPCHYACHLGFGTIFLFAQLVF